MTKPSRLSLVALSTMAALASPTALSAVLEEVVVTAQKRTESLQDVPITITALSSEALSDFGIDSLFELADLVPGMVFSRAPDDGLALTLRGLGTPARTQSFDQSVALFLDGMFLGKGRMYSSAFFDVERIEVIKGTQSTLLGKNTSLGAISITSQKPGETLGGRAQVSAEFENGGWFADGGIDIPLSDTFALRLAGRAVEQDGWVKNTVTGQDVPSDSETAFRATAVYTPSDALDATLTLQQSDSERVGNGFQYIDHGGYLPPAALEIYGEARLDATKKADCPECPGNESFHDTEMFLAGITVNWDIGSSTLTSVTSWADYDLKFFDDFDFGNAFDETTFLILNPGTVDLYSTYFRREEEYDQFSQELRITSDTDGRVEYLAGLFYFESDWESSEAQFFRTPNFPPAGPTNQIFNGSFTNNFDQTTETWSAFGQATLHFNDSLRGTLGLRYTDESKDISFQRVQGDPKTLWNTVINPPFDAPLSFEDDFLNGNLSIQFDATDTAMVYAAYGLGSKTGGFAESAEVGSSNPALSVDDGGARVETETAQTYELGVKTLLADGSASLNVALFYTEVEDFQETSFLVTAAGAQFLTRNIDVESRGVEFDGLWQASESLRLSTGFTYADATHRNDGSKLAQAPELTGSIGLQYEASITSELQFSAGGFARYRDKMVSQINETFPSDSFSTLDLNISVSDINQVWQLSLIGTNVTNEVVTDFSGPPAAPVGALFGAPTGDQGITADAPSPLRTIRVVGTYNF